MSEARTLQNWMDVLNRYGNRPAVIELKKEGMHETSYEQLDTLSHRLAAGLKAHGVGQGDLVLLFARNSPTWIAACLGIMRALATPVPLDVQFDDDSLVHAFGDSQPRLVFSDCKRRDRLVELQLDTSAEVFLLDDENEQEPQSWRRLLGDASVPLPDAAPSDEAILFYTSGTTGPPKGVPLTHRNIATQVAVLLDAELVHDDDRVLLPLPPHHVYPLVVGVLSPLARGLPIVLPYSLTGPQMIRALKETQISVVIGVPRLYRALHEGIQAKVASNGWLSRGAMQSALAISGWLRRRCGLRAGKWLLRPLHQQFGPRLRVAACGGAPLDDDLAWQLETYGWQVAIGYGLTETSPLLTLNPPGQAKIGTVGKVIPDIEMRIDKEAQEGRGDVNGPATGEIVVRGPSVFSGYRNLPDKTNEVLTNDGWFRTGDLGFLDREGYLHVTGRKDTMLVTKGGENVQPDDVETAYAEHRMIREVGVLDDDGQLVALIVPETSELDGDDPQESIAQGVEAQGRDLPSHQRIDHFHLTRESLPRTRLGKLQRHKLRERLETVLAGDDETEQAPISVSDMASDDRALLDDPAAQQAWELLAKKYADRHLTPDSSVRLDLGVDSLEWMNLSLGIRSQVGVEIDEQAIERIETVRDLLREASEASAAGDSLGASVLDDPEATLSDAQRRHLQPHTSFDAMLSSMIFATNRFIMRWLFRLEVRGLENLPDGPFIMAPNHASYLDPPAVAAALPSQRLRETFWGGWTGTMFTNFLMRWFSRLTRVVPINPQRGVMSSLAFGLVVLDRGRNLVWFPEGQRSADGQLHRFRAGIGLLVEHRAARVVPTAIEGAFRSLPPGSWIPRPHKIRVTFGPPLDVQAAGTEGDDRDVHEQIAAALHDAVASLRNGK